MDLEKETSLAFICAVLCKSRDAYRSVCWPCRAIPYCVLACTLYRQKECILYGDFKAELVEFHIAIVC